jgi:hypothetical protein
MKISNQNQYCAFLQIFRKSYDHLSEFCHPNDYGFQLTKKINSGIVTYYDSPILSKEHLSFIHNFLITAPAMIWFYDKAYELLEKNEELPIIVR